MKIAVSLLVAGISFAAQGYRFVCNGILANGEERNDDCGTCDERTAARWEDPQVRVVVADSPLPKGLSLTDWHQVVKDSFKAWEIDGSKLRFIKVEGKNEREFGANEEIHEIFWITSKEEWRKLVGSGEFGTLGATLPSYSCSDHQTGRIIVDADLVLNGIGYIDWQVDCQNDDCASVQVTLAHELGHFVGLDHPCAICSTSIMSARAGFNIFYPLLDDMEGLRALYPDGTTGGFGFRCSKDKDCSVGKLCIDDGHAHYCSNTCQSDEDCSHGSICQSRAQGQVCTFVDGEKSGGRKEGESCDNAPCIEPMVCAGALEDNFYCYMPCDDDGGCSGKKTCVNVGDISLCMAMKGRGERCDFKDLCRDGLYCVFEGLTSGACRAPCKMGCRRNERCEFLEGGERACMPIDKSLMLDDGGSSTFDKTPASTSLGRDRVKLNESKGGCDVGPQRVNAISWWLLLLLLGLFLRNSQRLGRVLVKNNRPKVGQYQKRSRRSR